MQFIQGIDGRVLYVTHNWQEFAQCSDKKIIGTTGAQIVHPDDLLAVGQRTMEKWMRMELIANRLRILIDRKWVWVDSVSIPMLNRFGRFEGYRGIIQPVQTVVRRGISALSSVALLCCSIF